MKEMNYNRFNYKSYKSRIKCPIFVNRGAHQITKTAPKPFVKWYNRTTPQVIVHHTASHHTAPHRMVQCGLQFYNKKTTQTTPHHTFFIY